MVVLASDAVYFQAPTLPRKAVPLNNDNMTLNRHGWNHDVIGRTAVLKVILGHKYHHNH